MDSKLIGYKKNIEEYLDKVGRNTNYELWYLYEHLWLQRLKDKYDKPLEYLAALTAIFSINKKWSENQKMVIEYLEEGTIRGLGIMKNKVDKLNECSLDEYCIRELLSGLKIQNFFINLYRPYETTAVTIDRYMCRIAKHHNEKPTSKQYNLIAEAYKQVAYSNKLIPNRLQALLWCHKIQE